MAFVVPILIASILGWLDLQAATGSTKDIPVAFVDLDGSEMSKTILTRLQEDHRIKISSTDLDQGRGNVLEGITTAAIVIPKGFGQTAGLSMTGGPKAEVTLITDPAKPAEAQVVNGVFLQDASETVASETFGQLMQFGTDPIKVNEEVGAVNGVKWGKVAHDYAGFGLQGLLFFAVEAAVSLARERRHGIWRRLRASPVSPGTFVIARGFTSTVLAFLIILVMFAVGAGLFGIRLLGNPLGFLCLCLATALMTATFGLLFATIGRSESQSRGLGLLVILIMLASGGAWFPIRNMPTWVQTGAEYLPVRWAVEGFDGVTWRGSALPDSLKISGLLLVFSLVFGSIALLRFKFCGTRPSRETIQLARA